MKYIIIAIVGVIAVFGLCFFVSWLIRRKMKKKIPMILHVLIGIVSGLIIITAAVGIYFSIHYSADEKALALLNDKNATEIDKAYFIDGDGEDTALIFYPGAKVDSEAYLPLMKRLADSGIDCFIVKPPLRFALFDINAADRIIEKYSYKHVFVSGHSMGGVAASSYASKNPDKVDGVVLLAAYPNSEISDDISLISVYGSEDKVLDRDAYKNAAPNFPKSFKEVIIKGGNHAYFGNYVEQSGDGEANITRDEQQKQTADAITEYIKYVSPSFVCRLAEG